MAYIRITSNCNMACEHCCVSSSKFIKGQHMSIETFKKAMKFCENSGESIFLGGGEPTIHPKFAEILGLALMHDSCECGVGLITNGKRTDVALKLARMAKAGIIYCGLSLDEYHDPIDHKVVEAFTKKSSAYSTISDRDQRDIRRTRQNINVGFAKSNGIGEREDCCCPELFVDPDGTIWQCGCKEVKFGTLDEWKIPDWFSSGLCSKENENLVDYKGLPVLPGELLGEGLVLQNQQASEIASVDL
jgi:sulfatase maturation enzyme AslB (radical SAM superfamily)